jgi:hypothetical protein
MIITPLYGHTDEATARLINDYPYGGMRCRIKFWLESSKTKGFRFVSQTENPKTFRWNAPKKSTYVTLAACMYLDENNHTQWQSLRGDKAQETLDFIAAFPQADLSNIKALVIIRLRQTRITSEGKAVWSIGGVPQMPSEDDIARAKEEVVLWQKCWEALR